MKRNVLLGSLVLWLSSATPALADRVILTNGGVLKGTIVKETRRYVQIKRGGIVTKVKRDRIDRVEKTDWAKELAKKEKAADKRSAQSLFEVADFAQKHELTQDATRLAKAAIAQDSNHAEARHLLGYRRVKGEWLRGDDLKRARGLVHYRGKWVTPQVKAEREAARVARERRATSAPAAAKRAPKRSEGGVASKPKIVLPAEDDALLKTVRGSGPVARREAAAATLSERGGQAKEALTQSLDEALTKARKKLLNHFERGKGKVRAKLARKIAGRRKEALGVIFDKSRYPDANHGAAGQHLVDAAVAKLRRAYDDPLRELADDDEPKKLLGEVRRLVEWSKRYAGSDADAERLEQELAAEVAKAIDMRRFPIDGTDAKILRKSQETVARNAKTKTSATPEEKACMLATNRYRMIFGMRALRLDELLVRAARGHSADMDRLRFFDHTSPVPGKRSPADRCKAEGASYAGENIAMGMRTGVGAFQAWYTSSGHHRNMLTKGHGAIGVGQQGSYWTQNFGY